MTCACRHDPVPSPGQGDLRLDGATSAPFSSCEGRSSFSRVSKQSLHLCRRIGRGSDPRRRSAVRCWGRERPWSQQGSSRQGQLLQQHHCEFQVKFSQGGPPMSRVESLPEELAHVPRTVLEVRSQYISSDIAVPLEVLARQCLGLQRAASTARVSHLLQLSPLPCPGPFSLSLPSYAMDRTDKSFFLPI